jgi:N-acetylglucosaminyl-diphospho-decaprenol L-rhamnosyltransferase
MGAPVCSVIVVSHGGEDLLRACLASVPATVCGEPVETIVVDSASPDATPDMVEREFPGVRLIREVRNLGFAAGNNVALRVCRGRYVMLLNPDAALRAGTLETCVKYLERHPAVSVVAPRIVNPDGSLQFSLRNFPTARTAVFEALLLHRLFPGATPRMAETITDPRYYQQERTVRWATGAALVARASAFGDVGGLDERFFLFSEETDWFRRAADRGLGAVYLPQAVVVHRSPEGRSSELMRYAIASRLLYARKHLPGPSAGVVRVVLGLGLAARLVAWWTISLCGNDRAQSRSKAYRIGLLAAIRPKGAGHA